MSKRKVTTSRIAEKRASARSERVGLSAEEVKTRLRERGTTLKQWSEANGFSYQTVSQVVRGINRGTFGQGHRIAVALGMK